MWNLLWAPTLDILSIFDCTVGGSQTIDNAVALCPGKFTTHLFAGMSKEYSLACRLTGNLCLLFSILLWIISSAASADLIIRNATLFSATDASFVEGANILIAGDRIELISYESVNAPGAISVDATGSTVMPGLIDIHVHLFFDLQDEAYFPSSDSEISEYAEQQLPNKLKSHLEQGFTTLLSPIKFWPQIISIRGRIASGELVGPRLFVAGGVFIAPGMHYICKGLEGERKRWCNDHLSAQVGNAGEVRESVRRYADSGVDVIVYDSLTNSAEVDDELVRTIVNAAHSLGLPVLVHGSDTAGFSRLIRAGIDGFVHPPSGPAEKRWVMVEESNIPIGITIGETEEASRSGKLTSDERTAYEMIRHNTQELLDKGAILVFASDMPGAPPSQTLPIVLRSLTDLGLNNIEVLWASTRNAARALGLAHELGTLEPGKLADILIVAGDPRTDLDALSKVELVIKDGKIVVDNRVLNLH